MTAVPQPGELALLERLIRIETKLDDARLDQADHEQRIRQLETPHQHHGLDVRINDHENRLRGLEKFRWQLVGAYAVAGVLSGVAGSLVVPYIAH